MSIALRVALFLAALCLPAAAQEIELGTGLICDTSNQVERVAMLLDGDPENAVGAVNAEDNSTACAIASIAYVRGREAETVRNKAGTYQIVKILVVGVVTPTGLQVTAPAAFYSLFKVEEYET